MENKRPSGFWILLGIGILLNIFYLIGQTMAFINYDFTVAMELQEPAEEITAIGVAFNKGFGFGDTIFYIPIFLMGIVGLLKRKEYGLYAMAGAMAVTVYWPAVTLSTLYFAKGDEGFYFTDYLTYSIVLPLISLYGLWGLFFVFRNRKRLIQD